MNQLTLRLKRPLPERLSLYGLHPQGVSGLTTAEIAKLQLRCVQDEQRRFSIGELFDISGGANASGAIESLLLIGDLSLGDDVGGGLAVGRLEVQGSVGDSAAAGMTGGRLHIFGSAGSYLAGAQRGGQVIVEGQAGPFAAAAPPGGSRGMQGGLLVVRGSVASGFATRMRRGIALMCGRVTGEWATDMIAGSIVIVGSADQPYACGMRRGSILFLSHKPPAKPARALNTASAARDTASQHTALGAGSGKETELEQTQASSLKATELQSPPGFTAPEMVELTFLPMLLEEITEFLPQSLVAAMGCPEGGRPTRPPHTTLRSLGDCAAGGQGEILWANWLPA